MRAPWSRCTSQLGSRPKVARHVVGDAGTGVVPEASAVCSIACDDGEACPGNSVCREFQTRRGPVQACLGAAEALDTAPTAVDLCAGFLCEVACRDDVPCGDGLACVDGACVTPPPPSRDDDNDAGDGFTFGGGGLRYSAGGPDPAGFGLVVALLGLLRRRRR